MSTLDRVRPALGADAKSPVDAVSLRRAQSLTRRAQTYSSLADDGGAAKNKREAAMMISVAEGQLSDGRIKESLEAAEQAMKLFESMQDETGESDAIAIIIDAHKQQADNDKQQPAKALEVALSKMTAFEKAGKKRAEACMMLAACDIYASMSRASKDLDKSLSFGRDALKIFQSLPDKKMEASTYLALMNVNFQKKMPSETMSQAKKALEVYKEIGDKKGEAKALHGLAMAYSVTDDLNEAVSQASDAEAIYDELGDKGAKARELQSIARWNLEVGKAKEALEAAQDSLNILRDLDTNMQREAQSLLLVCEALAAAGKGRQAVKLAKAGLHRFEDTGDKRAVAAGLEVLVETYMQADDPGEALNAANNAIATARELGDKRLQLHLLHQACHAQRHSFEAGTVMKQAVRIAQEIGDTDEEAQALLMYGYTQIQRLDIQTDKPAIQEAVSLVGDAALLFAAKGYTSGEGNCKICLSCLRSLNKDKEQVLPLAREAQQLFNACGNVDGEACSYRMIVEALLVDKEYKAALDAANSWVDVRRGAGERRKLVDAMLKVASIHLAQGANEMALNVAEEAMDIISEIGCQTSEAKILCFITEIHLSYLSAEDVPEQRNGPLPGKFLERRSKAMTAVKKALVLAGKNKLEEMRGVALLLRAQVLTFNDKGTDALRSAIEAEKVFAKTNAVQNQSSAQILCGKLYFAFGDKVEALKLAKSALELVRQPGYEEPDTESAALEFIEKLEPKAKTVMQADVGAAMPITAAPMPTTLANPGLDIGMVKSKLYEMVMNNIATGEDIDHDASLGDSGLDSLASVQLVTDVGREFKISLSPAAVFDYPTIKTLTEHIIEESRDA